MTYKKIIYLISIILILGLISCDNMLGGWFETPAGSRDVIWMRVDGVEGMLNPAPTNDGTYPRLVVYNGDLYAGWIEGNMSYFKKYNGDDDNPNWEAAGDDTSTSPTDLVMKVYDNNLYIGFISGTNFNVKWYDGISTFYTASAGPVSITASSPDLAVYQNNLFGVWNDTGSGLIRSSSYYWETDIWTPVDDGGTNGINDNPNPASSPRLAANDSMLYAVFLEFTGTEDIVKVRTYDGGTAWSEISGNLNYDQNPAINAYTPSIISADYDFYLAWTEDVSGTAGKEIHVSSAYGYYIDEGTEPGISYFNPTSGNNVVQPILSVVNDRLYAVWIESDGLANQLRACLYSDSSEYENWEFIDGNINTGLNIDTQQPVSSLHTVAYNSKIYIIFTEYDTVSGWDIVHVKVGK